MSVISVWRIISTSFLNALFLKKDELLFHMNNLPKLIYFWCTYFEVGNVIRGCSYVLFACQWF